MNAHDVDGQQECLVLLSKTVQLSNLTRRMRRSSRYRLDKELNSTYHSGPSSLYALFFTTIVSNLSIVWDFGDV